MNKTLCILSAATLLAVSSSCSSDNKFEQTNRLVMVTVMQSPGEETIMSTPLVTTHTDAYNPNDASVEYSNLILPSGLTTSARIDKLFCQMAEDNDRLSIKSTTSSTATGFGGLQFNNFELLITNSNAAAMATFADGTALFSISNPLIYFTTSRFQSLADPTQVYETSEYTRNQISVELIPAKKTANLSIGNACFSAAEAHSTINIKYEGIPFTFDATTGIITLTSTEEIVPYRFSNNLKGDELPQYAANGLKMFLYGKFGQDAYMTFKTPTLEVRSTLYQYGEIPNQDPE